MALRIRITKHARGGTSGDPFNCAITREVTRQYGGYVQTSNGAVTVSHGPIGATRYPLNSQARQIVRTHDQRGPRTVRDQEVTLSGPSMTPRASVAREWTQRPAAVRRVQATALRKQTVAPAARHPSQPAPRTAAPSRSSRVRAPSLRRVTTPSAAGPAVRRGTSPAAPQYRQAARDLRRPAAAVRAAPAARQAARRPPQPAVRARTAPRPAAVRQQAPAQAVRLAPAVDRAVPARRRAR